MMRYSALLLVLLFPCLLAACDVPANQALQHFDHVADDLPFPAPALTRSDTFPQAPALPEDAVKRLSLQRAFFARDFSTLDPAINAAHQRYVEGEDQEDLTREFVESIEQTELAGIDACRDWLAEKPGSYAAHLACGALWLRGAWAARGDEYADKVTPIRFALMRERLARSNALLEKAVTLAPKPLEALTLLADNRLAVSERDAAGALLARAESIMPAYVLLHDTRIRYAQAKWGGSPDDVAAGIALAKKAGVDEDALAYFQDHYVAHPWEMSDPGAERTYWEKAIAERPTVDRLRSVADYFNRMQNWRDGLPAASRLIDKDPSNAKAYWLRGAANEKLGHFPEALADYRMAAAQGYDFATQALIQAYVQGGLGLGSKNWEALDSVCRHGAALGSAAAANCMASMFWEGDRVGGPFRTNVPQAFAWHLVAARAGYHNSQYDLGWLLLTGRAPGVGKEQAERDGLFWLRRAAERDQQFARKKLQEGGYAESEQVGQAPGMLDRVLEFGRSILRAVS
jgi:TPR repeat protein